MIIHPILQGRKLNNIIPRVCTLNKNVLFAKRILLVEGISDLYMCQFLNRKLEMYLEAEGVEILPVEGKGQFPIIVKLLRLIGKETAILTDLDGFTDNKDIINIFNQDKKAEEVVIAKGHSSLIQFCNEVYDDFCKLCDEEWESIKEFQEHPYWTTRSSDDDKIKRRAAMATILNMDEEDILQYDSGNRWNSIKVRLMIMFECLEVAGCFVLRKGAIESYYCFEDKETHIDKINTVVDEIEKLEECSAEDIVEKYSDIVRALEYINRGIDIDEVGAVKQMLAAEVGAIFVRGLKFIENKDISLIIKQVRQNKPSLFEYELVKDKRLKLKVTLKSNILDVRGFPLEIFEDENPIFKIDTMLENR